MDATCYLYSRVCLESYHGGPGLTAGLKEAGLLLSEALTGGWARQAEPGGQNRTVDETCQCGKTCQHHPPRGAQPHTHAHTDTREPLAPALEQTFSLSMCYVEVLITFVSLSHAQTPEVKRSMCLCGYNTHTHLYSHSHFSSLCVSVCLSWRDLEWEYPGMSESLPCVCVCVFVWKPYLMSISFKLTWTSTVIKKKHTRYLPEQFLFRC